MIHNSYVGHGQQPALLLPLSYLCSMLGTMFIVSLEKGREKCRRSIEFHLVRSWIKAQ
jgi:hypothetical protein